MLKDTERIPNPLLKLSKANKVMNVTSCIILMLLQTNFITKSKINIKLISLGSTQVQFLGDKKSFSIS